jgi:TRAP-type transport system periplasmic protein
VPKNFIEPWTKKVEAESNGRIKFEIYPAMQLGGAPPALVQQVQDGFVDIVWTLTGYTPGVFPKSEVVEMPFLAGNAQETSRALQRLYESDLKDEYEGKGIHVITLHVHSPGLIHSKDPITNLEDMKGKKVRGPTRVITKMLERLGSTPVGMPVPQVPESLSKGVIDATVIPWEVTTSLKTSQIVHNHTSFSGDKALYVASFVFGMNKAKYDSLPPDLKKVLDDNSGVFAADWLGKVMDAGDAPGLKMAQDLKNNFIVLDEAETARWKAAADPIYADWVADVKGQGIDGDALLEKFKGLLAEESK